MPQRVAELDMQGGRFEAFQLNVLEVKWSKLYDHASPDLNVPAWK